MFSKGAPLVTYSSVNGYAGAVPGPHGPTPPSPYRPPVGPQPSGALAIISFITGLIAFLAGWVPFLGLALGVLGLIFSILAVRKPTLRGLAVAGVVLSTLATVASIVTTGLFLLAIAGSSGSSSEPVTAASYSPEDFTATNERTLSGIAKDPDAHAGETLILYGYVTQFDADTGPCTMRLSVSAAQGSSRFDYEHNSLAYSGDGDSTCPELDDVVADDEVKLTVILHGGKSYNSIGGNTTVPYFEVVTAEVR